jgi:hypothetical protein
MIQHFPDLFLALKSGIEGWIRFKIHQRDFHCDGLCALPVVRLEYRAHAAAMNHFADLKPIVEYLSDFDLDAHS